MKDILLGIGNLHVPTCVCSTTGVSSLGFLRSISMLLVISFTVVHIHLHAFLFLGVWLIDIHKFVLLFGDFFFGKIVEARIPVCSNIGKRVPELPRMDNARCWAVWEWALTSSSAEGISIVV